MTIRFKWKTIDRVMGRVAQFTQLGLFIVAVWGLFYTVVPLYKIALLDDSLARKELQLLKVEDKLNAAYGRIRHASVREFVLLVGPDCSGLTLPPDVFAVLSGKPHTQFDNYIFDTSIAECFGKHLTKDSSLRELSADDRIHFENELRALGRKLDTKRFELRDKYHFASEQERLFFALNFSADTRRAILELANIKWQ